MSFTFPLSDFFESSGNSAAVFGEQLRDGIAGFACGLWSAYPAFITEGTLPGQSFARGFMNQMCSPIQSAVPAPQPPFVGGQCSGVQYKVDFEFEVVNIFDPLDIRIFTDTLFTMLPGAILQVTIDRPSNTVYNFDLIFDDGNGQTSTSTDPFGTPWRSTGNFQQIVITRTDGMPDTCGDPEVQYTSPPPTSIDLSTTINITNLDGVDNVYNVVYNKISNNYNFPLGFKVNGVNVTLDFGGLTFHGPSDIVQPTSGNDPLPPGSDGGEDGVGGQNDTIFPLQDFLVFPSFTTPDVLEDTIEYLVCESGIISTITTTLKTIPAQSFGLKLLIELIGFLLQEICEATAVEPIVGLPEYYGLRPGVDRPAIVYLYKEFINGVWDPSTYSSTVPNPNAAAVAAINTILPPDKTMGTIVTSLTLSDGSNIKASGDTEMESLNNFNFLLNQVDPSLIQPDAAQRTTVTSYPRLQVKTVKCRQIEYYPTGKQAGINPTIKRIIDA